MRQSRKRSERNATGNFGEVGIVVAETACYSFKRVVCDYRGVDNGDCYGGQQMRIFALLPIIGLGLIALFAVYEVVVSLLKMKRGEK